MRYRVRVESDGGQQELELDAADDAQLRQSVADMGLSLIEATPLEKRKAGFTFRKPVFERALFTQELIALLEAGLSLVETVETLRDKSRDGLNRTVLAQIVSALYEGEPLSRALERQPAHFPPLYVATVASAEQTGHLAEALKRYHHYDARLSVVRKKVVSSMVYPSIVIATGALIVLFLAFYVIPKFSQVFASMKEIPFSARVMLAWGNLVEAHGGLLLAGVVGAIVGAGLSLRSEKVRARLFEAFMRLPKLADYQRLFALTRFYRTLGLLLAGGMSMVTSMELAAQVLPAQLQTALAQALDEIRAGKPLSGALPAANLTTPVAERLIRVGEQSGELAGMVTRSAEFCDEELDRAIDTLMRVVEPVLMLVVGSIIGTIIFLLYMPIFQLAGAVG
ncbi:MULTISPECIES: type II secretion system F family protein [Caballeronia]|uniref:Type II secretion system protein n=1 Tax=Caballeronia zhejiangensis TaxID=871203 RepID=A0A656QDL1_9BURK|nr:MULTISPECIES: type II secretion system F family protein [Caballeronia]KDR24802.1 type II secretion system protein [Caballeronia zhejiangensis]MDR5764455.1 type II secretion system F family protein [Caballeronia sp. LZ028]MDR5792364.1 type II secretion system F family protein [Caballeronia sp. LZ008]